MKNFWPLAFGVFGLVLVIRLSNYTPEHSLPHRPITPLTNHGQGNQQITNQCPAGSYIIETQGMFLECLHAHVN